MNIVDIVYSELYIGVYLSHDPALEEKRIQQFLAVNEIEVKRVSLRMSKRVGELYAKHLRKTKSTFKRILPDFIIGAHAEQHSNAFVTWNPSDYDLSIPVMTPSCLLEDGGTFDNA